MSPKSRRDGPGFLHHVTARVNWRARYLEEAGAKICLARFIRDAAEEFGVDIFAAVLMSNHLHMVVRSPPEPLYRHHTSRRTPNRHVRPWPKGHQKSTILAQFMRSVRQRMSLLRQRELGLSGRFWEGRYDARPIEDPTSLIVRMAYDHRNPVKQGMVALPEHFPWSTAQTWRSGEITALPVLIRQALPFEFEYATLRRELLRFQGDERLDKMDEALERLWAAAGPVPPEAWSALFDRHGVDPVH